VKNRPFILHFQQKSIELAQKRFHRLQLSIENEKIVQNLTQGPCPIPPLPKALAASVAERFKRPKWKKLLAEVRHTSSLLKVMLDADKAILNGPSFEKEFSADPFSPIFLSNNREIRVFVGGSRFGSVLQERQLLLTDVYPYLRYDFRFHPEYLNTSNLLMKKFMPTFFAHP
jgi:hypothetical protein